MVPDDPSRRRDDPSDSEWGAGRRPRDSADEPGSARGERDGDGARKRSDRGRRESRRGGRRWDSNRRDSRSRRGALDSLLEGSSTTVNALIGGAGGIVFSFIPFSTVLGGIVAGYLEAGPGGSGRASTSAGLTVGGIAGAIMFVPFLLFAYVGFAIVAASGSTTLGGIVLVIFLFAALYTIGAGMIGGVIGVLIREEVEDRPERRRGW